MLIRQLSEKMPNASLIVVSQENKDLNWF